MRTCEQILLIKLAILLGNAYLVYGVSLRCYDGSINKFTEIPINDPTCLLNASGFVPDREIIIYAFGFLQNATDFSVHTIIGAYLKKYVNTLLLNWEKEANVPILGPLSYGIVVFNVKQVGAQLGEAIIKLQDAGLYLPSLHLIGFSLGAHVMGYAGRHVKSKGYSIPRITGLDPAGPLYDGQISFSGLDSSTATFVDVIHSNPGRLGTIENLGTVDIWPNCGQSVQPDCEKSSITMLPTRNGCSHERAFLYFAESLEEPLCFPAKKAPSCSSWKAGDGTDEIIYMGDNIDRTARGTFYLRTNSYSPYGLGNVGTEPAEEEADVGILEILDQVSTKILKM